ncbi:rhomboid-related protein 2 [Anoplophora glabripennis]|uniref:rhomboid-related protein 2 n=1 Tax=Anoplophora glabripennis TaxID=217634 RepID=UPI0008737D20|nr:rhomboid-related protein 2 [Anoplophora glabripennis]
MPRQNLDEVPLNDFNSHYRHIFDTVDTNNDGYICVWELEDFINSSNEEANIVPRHVVKKIHKMADDNGDKKLDYREFVNMLEHPDLQHLFGQYVTSYVNFIVPRQKRAAVYGVEDRQLIDEYTCCPPPVFMFLISILEVAFHLTDEITEKNSTLSGSGVTAQIFIYDPQRRHEVWRYLTYMFVHIGYTHLLVNLAVQLVLGVPLEMVHKGWRVLVVYFAGVLAGSLANSITDPRCRLAGASGGVYALLTAHIACAIMNWSEMMFPYVQITVYIVIVACDLGQSIYDRYFLKVQSPVGIAAHLGGAIAGLLVGIYILRNLQQTKTEKYIWWVALVLYILLMGAAIVINIAWPGYFAGAF